MIVRAADAILTVLVGLGIGYGLRTLEPSSPVEAPSSRNEALAPRPDATPVPARTAAESCPDSVRRPPAVVASLPALPPPYLEIIGPLEERSSPTAYETYTAFTRESRDEPWAAAMEAGVKSWAAGLAPRDRMSIDYVECRSLHCVIAGRSSEGRTVFEGNDVRDQGWWQAERTLASFAFSSRDGSLYFLWSVQRYPDSQ